MVKDAGANEGAKGANGAEAASNGAKVDPNATKMSIRCVLATGSVDLKVRVFAA